jgi:hypothetical protein
LLEARGADAVRALFVFLDLLKRQPELPAEYLLRLKRGKSANRAMLAYVHVIGEIML